MNTINLSKQIIELDAAIKEANEGLKDLKERRSAIEGMLLESMANDGVTSMAVDGKTLYTSTTMRANIAKSPEALEALDLDGGGDMIKRTVDGRTLATWLKDRERPNSMPGDSAGDRFDIDTELAEYISVHDQAHVRVRKKQG